MAVERFPTLPQDVRRANLAIVEAANEPRRTGPVDAISGNGAGKVV